MRLLLDTHVFLWFITEDLKLPGSFGEAIREDRNEVFLSVASVWKAVVKYRLGKLPLPAPPAQFLPAQRQAHGILALPIDEGAMAHLAGLPPLHHDPFDRLLVAHAIQHQLTIVSVDQQVLSYPAPSLAPV